MSPRRLPALALAGALTVTALTGCGDSGSGSDKPQVVASFYPLQFVAERIVGDHAEVSNLTEPGVEPHDLELSPRQAARLADADVVFYEKGLQPAVDEAVSNDAPDNVVDAAEVVELHHADEHAEEEAGHEEEAHEEEAHEEEGSEDHDHGDTDPHFWLDPTLLAQTAEAFTASIEKADPDNAAAYTAANDALQAELRSLDQELTAGLENCAIRTVVVSHDAFGYLGERYDLEIHPIAGLSPDAEPSARQIAELSDVIREEDVTTVFSERLASPKLAETLASDLDVRTAVLDPIEGLASKDATGDYLSLMRSNLAAIQKAGSCT